MIKLSVIIPAYNEEKTVLEVVRSVSSLNLDKIEKEIVVVDDGSRDKTFDSLSSLNGNIKNLTILRHKRNKGKGAAVQTGIKKATGDIVLIQDADLEYNPKDIPNLIKPILNKQFKVVYGTRLKTKPVLLGKNKTPFLTHFFGNKFLSFITSVLYQFPVSDMETGYKVFNKKALDGIKLKAKSFDFEPEITAKILKKGIKIKEINIKIKPRSYEEGKKINTLKDGFIALWTLIKYRFLD